ncbi:Aste57867_17497 [Aphanomyces stellatus]|uniref:Aste57867_17497 protein n=1 Tax=Aphanomyces stellatus TaxID=120398 RepID=A0A485L848_9STRA|nr:hypothetical protein As57867_017437 [Aphanomyces stellatus]VFT94250.1 Aste57867_17497 [Aphanomyces stellatus]
MEACCRRGGLLVVGIATINIFSELPDVSHGSMYVEDSKIRVLESWKCRCGNVTNTLVVASQIGAFDALQDVAPATKSDAKCILESKLAHSYGIELPRCEIVPSGAMPRRFINRPPSSRFGRKDNSDARVPTRKGSVVGDRLGQSRSAVGPRPVVRVKLPQELDVKPNWTIDDSNTLENWVVQQGQDMLTQDQLLWVARTHGLRQVWARAHVG